MGLHTLTDNLDGEQRMDLFFELIDSMDLEELETLKRIVDRRIEDEQRVKRARPSEEEEEEEEEEEADRKEEADKKE